MLLVRFVITAATTSTGVVLCGTLTVNFWLSPVATTTQTQMINSLQVAAKRYQNKLTLHRCAKIVSKFELEDIHCLKVHRIPRFCTSLREYFRTCSTFPGPSGTGSYRFHLLKTAWLHWCVLAVQGSSQSLEGRRRGPYWAGPSPVLLQMIYTHSECFCGMSSPPSLCTRWIHWPAYQSLDLGENRIIHKLTPLLMRCEVYTKSFWQNPKTIFSVKTLDCESVDCLIVTSQIGKQWVFMEHQCGNAYQCHSWASFPPCCLWVRQFAARAGRAASRTDVEFHRKTLPTRHPGWCWRTHRIRRPTEGETKGTSSLPATSQPACVREKLVNFTRSSTGWLIQSSYQEISAKTCDPGKLLLLTKTDLDTLQSRISVAV